MVSNFRAEVLSLGINLGWLQQGAQFGGRPIAQMTADLERVRGHATRAGYSDFAGTINAALSQLGPTQPPSNVLDEVTLLISHFQNQSTGQAAQALALGINLGWLQQGASANNRPVSLATADLERVRTHAGLAGYTNYSGFVDVALSRLTGGQQVASILGEVTALIGLFQGQS